MRLFQQTLIYFSHQKMVQELTISIALIERALSKNYSTVPASCFSINKFKIIDSKVMSSYGEISKVERLTVEIDVR